MDTRPKLTNDANWRGDAIASQEEIEEANKALRDAADEDLSPSHWKVTAQGNVEKKMPSMIDPSQWNLGDIPEPEVLPDGEEVKVSIISVSDAETRERHLPYWRITLEVPDQPLIRELTYQLYKVYDGQSPRENFNTRRNLQDFFKAFKLDMHRPFDPERDWIGETAWCIVSMREDPQYGKQNQVRKWILPR